MVGSIFNSSEYIIQITGGNRGQNQSNFKHLIEMQDFSEERIYTYAWEVWHTITPRPFNKYPVSTLLNAANWWRLLIFFKGSPQKCYYVIDDSIIFFKTTHAK